MKLVDVNILLYATITGFPQHERARSWWEGALNGSVSVGLSAPALFGYLRVATNPKVFETPMGIEEVLGQVRSWLDLPIVEFVQPGPRHLDLVFGMLARLGTAGNLTAGVQLAALAVEHDAQMCSTDTDFGRFPEVEWINPLS